MAKKMKVYFISVCLIVGSSICIFNSRGDDKAPSIDIPSLAFFQTIEGTVVDASAPFGVVQPITCATIKIAEQEVRTHIDGTFSIEGIFSHDSTLTVSAPGYALYDVAVSEIENKMIYLIPERLYKDVSLITWDLQRNSRSNWSRKWTHQPEFIIVRERSNPKQIETILNVLRKDVIMKRMTGGRYSAQKVVIYDSLPSFLRDENLRAGKIIIHFMERMLNGSLVQEGGRAYSEDKGTGTIIYGEVAFYPEDTITSYMVLHELVHALSTGGHINYRPSIVNEMRGETLNGEPTEEDYAVLACIYNSPPKRLS